jgi:prolipoprotein diacylglyceryl transferase
VTHLIAYLPAPPFQDLSLGPLNFRLYGLCIALGALAGVAIMRRRWQAMGGDPEDMTTIALVAIPAGMIGTRIYHVVTDWSRLYSGGRWWPDAFMIWKGGLGIPGGIVLGTLAGVLTARRLKVSVPLGFDAAAPAVPLAQAIGRIGNYFNQELFGRPTKVPWGLNVDVPYRPLKYAEYATFHPTFAYEALWNFGLVGFIVWAGKKIVLKPGRWFSVYLVGYGVGRFWVELMRSDTVTKLLGLRVNTWVSALIFLVGIVWMFWGGSPVDAEATAELRAGGNPREFAAGPGLAVLRGEVPAGADATPSDAGAGTVAEQAGADVLVDDADLPSGPADGDPEDAQE